MVIALFKVSFFTSFNEKLNVTFSVKLPTPQDLDHSSPPFLIPHFS